MREALRRFVRVRDADASAAAAAAACAGVPHTTHSTTAF